MKINLFLLIIRSIQVKRYRAVENCSSFASLWFERWLVRACKCAAMWDILYAFGEKVRRAKANVVHTFKK